MAALVLAFSAQSFAQNEVGRFSIIPRLGVSVANLSNNDLYYLNAVGAEDKLESRSKAGLNVGVDVEYQVSEQASVSAGVFYSMQGACYPDFKEMGASDKQFVGNSNNRTDLQYINVPLMANLYVSKGLAMKLGVQPGFLLDAQYKYETRDITVKDDNTKEYGNKQTMKEDIAIKSFDLSIPVGISYEYMNVILDARYNIGLTKIYENDFYKSRNNVFTVTVGYRFAL